MNNNIPYTPPSFESDGFNCPFCQAYADQNWAFPTKVVKNTNYGSDKNYAICRCTRCGQFSIWVNKDMVFPRALTSPPPNSDLPEEIKTDYEEARAILLESPRRAAALLRLSIQKLCKHLGENGETINDDIASLVKKGLPSQVQQALDIVRVVGNNAVHPGQIDLNDNKDVANSLFSLVNLIADTMITQPKHVEELYQNVVPEPQCEAIKRRDGS